MNGKSFPHGFPPIRWDSWGQYDSAVEQAQESDLPGVASGSDIPNGSHEALSGNAVIAGFYAAKGNQSWFIAADGMTAKFLYDVLQLPVDLGGCDIDSRDVWGVTVSTVHSSPGPIMQSQGILPGNAFTFYPWNVLQYYRGSSVLLGNMTYDNLASHNNNQNTSYWSSTPLNTTGIDMDFLHCLNTTIAAAVPIIDPGLVSHHKLTSGEIAGVVIGAIVCLCLLCYCGISRSCGQCSRPLPGFGCVC